MVLQISDFIDIYYFDYKIGDRFIPGIFRSEFLTQQCWKTHAPLRFGIKGITFPAVDSRATRTIRAERIDDAKIELAP